MITSARIQLTPRPSAPTPYQIPEDVLAKLRRPASARPLLTSAEAHRHGILYTLRRELDAGHVDLEPNLADEAAHRAMLERTVALNTRGALYDLRADLAASCVRRACAQAGR